jgi:hypothetical protein
VTDASGVKKDVPLQSAKETSLAWAAGVRNDRSNNVVAYPGNTENYLSIAGAAAAMVAEVLGGPTCTRHSRPCSTRRCTSGAMIPVGAWCRAPCIDDLPLRRWRATSLFTSSPEVVKRKALP